MPDKIHDRSHKMCNNRLRIAIRTCIYVTLLISLLSNVWLLQQARHYARQAQLTRLDPLGLDKFPGGQASAALLKQSEPGSAPRRVLFFGDSRALQWHAPQNGDFSFINRGISGQTSTQALQRFDYHVSGIQPQIVVVQVGVNDLLAVSLLADRAWIVDNCKAHIRQIVERARAQGATVVLSTIMPMGALAPQQRLFWSDEVRVVIEEVNQYITSLADSHVLVLDTAAVLADGGDVVKPAYQVDFLHINREGYEALNRELVPLLQQAP